MEYLTSFDTSYSGSNPDNITGHKFDPDFIKSTLLHALQVPQQVELSDFKKGLGEAELSLLEPVFKSKPTTTDIAIIQALLTRYPGLKKNEKETLDFMDHVVNMAKFDRLTDGMLKHVLDHLVDKSYGKSMQEKKDEAKQQESDPDQEPQNNQPPQDSEEEGGPEGLGKGNVGGAETSEGSGASSGSQDTNNSDFYFEEWDDLFSDDISRLTEDDFKNLVEDSSNSPYLNYPSNQTATSEFKKNNLVNAARDFLERNRGKVESKLKRTKVPTSDREYSTRMIIEDFLIDKEFGLKN